jgi:prephenate dehydrogenase
MSRFAFEFDKLVIAGVGLIGGSLAQALARAHPAGRIVGIGRSEAPLRRALELGVVHEAALLDDAPALARALGGADLVVLAAPVAQTHTVLAALAPWLDAGALLTDAGSTKCDVVSAARAALGARIARFVPAHPIAGREASGVDAALPNLYAGRSVIVCPLPENEATGVARIRALWEAAGARVCMMAPEAHDRTFAAVSHLPHLLSFAYMEQLLDAPDAAARMALAGTGFRDFTRLAGSSPEMWRDICMANRTALLDELDRYGAVLATLRQAVAQGDGARLEHTFARARAARENWATAREARAATDTE